MTISVLFTLGILTRESVLSQPIDSWIILYSCPTYPQNATIPVLTLDTWFSFMKCHPCMVSKGHEMNMFGSNLPYLARLLSATVHCGQCKDTMMYLELTNELL